MAGLVQGGPDDTSDPGQRSIALLAAVKLIIAFKIVNIQQTQGKGRFLVPVKLTVQQFQEILSVDEAGELIDPRLIDGPFIDPGIPQGRGAERRHCLHGFQIILMTGLFLPLRQKNDANQRTFADHGNKVICFQGYK